MPTQPPGTVVTRDDDGRCWVACDLTTCDSELPLRVRCPAEGAPAPELATALRVPEATRAQHGTSVFERRADLRCNLTEASGRTHTGMPCPPELTATVMPGVVPVIGQHGTCYHGPVPVQCPPRFHSHH